MGNDVLDEIGKGNLAVETNTESENKRKFYIAKTIVWFSVVAYSITIASALGLVVANPSTNLPIAKDILLAVSGLVSPVIAFVLGYYFSQNR